MSKHPNTPRKQDKEAVTDQSNPQQEQEEVHLGASTLAQGNPTKVQTQTTNTKWRKSLDWWKPRIELVALVAGVGYALVTYLQWRDLRRNFLIDERPWVTTTDFILSEPATGTVMYVDYGVRNHGKTPAVHERASGDLHFWTEDQPMQPFHNIGTQENIIAPGDVSISARASFQQTPHQAEINDYLGRKRSLYIHGKVSYQDIFGKDHWTTFCAFHEYGTHLGKFTLCGKGNEVDRN
jgi:hypothetical protein